MYVPSCPCCDQRRGDTQPKRCAVESIREDHPLRRLFAGLVENAFCTQVGVCDPALTAYLSDLLVNFTHVDRLSIIRNVEDRRLDQIAAMLTVLSGEQSVEPIERDRTTYQQIGDYTLFWAGVYPEQLKRAARHPSDVLFDYVSCGKRSYAIVSRLVDEDDAPPSSLFRHLSEEFESCLYGLGLVRRGWEESDTPPGGRAGELLC